MSMEDLRDLMSKGLLLEIFISAPGRKENILSDIGISTEILNL